MKRVLIYILTAVVFTLSCICFYESCHPEKEAFIRQNTERDLADQYLIYIENLNVNSVLTFSECHSEEEDSAYGSDFLSYTDENYYERDGVTFTPDYAKGYLQCVLEIPKDSVQIRRGVYSGTWDDILYDLDIWMVTAARPDFVLGETRYVIYGHNHTVQDLSFNRLKNVEVGDIFYLTDENGVRNYYVTDVFKMSRADVREQIVNNENIGPDKCYIITCGRGEMRYYDLVVEGTFKYPD